MLFDSLLYKPDFLMNPKKKDFENIWGKGENSGNKHFLLFLNPFPNDKVLDKTKLKTFADDKLNNKKIIFLSLIE